MGELGAQHDDPPVQAEATAIDGGAEKLLAEVLARHDAKPVDEPVAEHEDKPEVVPKDDAAWEDGGDPNTEGSDATLRKDAREDDVTGERVLEQAEAPPVASGEEELLGAHGDKAVDEAAAKHEDKPEVEPEETQSGKKAATPARRGAPQPCSWTPEGTTSQASTSSRM